MENYNVVLMDHGNNWERVAKRTKGTSCTVFSPKKEKKLQINPWKVPYGFDPKDWMSKVLVQFCRAEGLLERSKVLIEEVVTGLYKEFGVFEEGISAKEVSERSSKVTFQKLYTELEAYLSKKVNAMVKERLLSHFSDFQDPDSFLCSFLGSSNGVSIDALIHTEGVTVLDCLLYTSGLVFAGRLKRADDINVVVRTIGREERIDDRDIVKWFPRSPTGWFVCQTSRTFDFKDAEPILVQISRLNIHAPSNAELDEILIQKKIAKVMSA